MEKISGALVYDITEKIIESNNIETENKFNQLCVWQGTVLGDSSIEDFINFFKEKLNARVKFCEEVKTNGSIERNEEGGRNDILFYIHDDNIPNFALNRFEYGIRWWEDVVSYNDNSYLYSQEILDKYEVKW